MPYMFDSLYKGSLFSSGIPQHLSSLLRERDCNPTQLKNDFEVFSHYLRTTQFQFKQLHPDSILNGNLSNPRPLPLSVSGVQSLSSKSPAQTVCIRPDLLQEYYALKSAGISVGEYNCFHLNKVLRVLAAEYQVTSIRFWGKMLGVRDYYVVQGYSTKPHKEQPNTEKYGSGVNKYSYWVAGNIFGRWVELPLVTPEQVQASREFKHIFSGNLQTPVIKGRFMGLEKHLLKCVVARITHSCQLSPRGIYRVNEEGVVEYEEDIKVPQVSQMNSLDCWVRVNPCILLQGRCTHYIDGSLSEEQREARVAELNEKDPMVERLKGIVEDKGVEPYPTAWTVALCGETMTVGQMGKQEGQSLLYAVVVVKNNAWPGAAVVGYRGGWTNIYVGYGHRFNQTYTMIRELKDIQVEGGKKVEGREPNPMKPVEKEEKEEKKEEVKEKEGQ